MTLNKKTEGTSLYEIDWTPKGSKTRQLVYVYAKNRLEASNEMIRRHLFGKQNSITVCNVNLLH